MAFNVPKLPQVMDSISDTFPEDSFELGRDVN